MKLNRSVRNRSILTSPTLPSFFAGILLLQHPIWASVILLSTIAYIFFLEKAIIISIRKKKEVKNDWDLNFH